MTPYQPRAGSIGERSIAYLAEHGQRLMRDVADAIDADIGTMSASLNLCVEHGLILRDVTAGGVYLRLPPAATLKTTADAQVALLETAVEHKAVPNGKTRITDLSADNTLNGSESIGMPQTSGDADIRASLQRAGSLAPAAEPEAKRHFEFGLFTDGRLVIELADTVATLTRDETERLYQFFRKVDAVGGLA